MESPGFEYRRSANKPHKEGNNLIFDDPSDYEVNVLRHNAARKQCPKCGRVMQKSGQKADSNGVIKQRFLCPLCKKNGRAPYNYFFTIAF